MLQFLSQYLSFWVTVFYLILEILKNLGLIKQTNTVYLAVYSLMFIVVTIGTLLITINGEKIRKNVDSPFKPNQMLLLHLVLLVYVHQNLILFQIHVIFYLNKGLLPYMYAYRYHNQYYTSLKHLKYYF